MTSSSSISRLPVTRMSACTAAPSATTSSGFSSLCGVRPNSSATSRRTSGMRVEPPTSTTSSICDGSSPASASAWRHGSSVRSTIGRISASNSARVMRACRAASVSSRSDRSHLGLDHRLADRLDRLPATRSGLRPDAGTRADATSIGRARGSISSMIDVVAAEVRVAVGRQHLEHAVLDAEDRDVERAAAEIVDGDDAGVPLVEAVGERRRGRLVDDAQHLEAGDPAGVARRRALRVVEVRRHGDDRAIDFGIDLALRGEVLLGAALQLAQDERRNLRRRELALAEADPDDAAAALAADDRGTAQRSPRPARPRRPCP